MQIRYAVTKQLISFFFFGYIGHAIYFLNLKFQASAHFCDCTALLVSDQVGDSEGRFSPHMAHIYAIVQIYIN